MIIVDSRKLRFLLAGRTLTIASAHRYRQGREYPLGVRQGHVVCHVHVLACTAAESGFALEVRQAEEAPVYLIRNPGNPRAYTDRPGSAARDAYGPIEAVDAQTLARYAREAYRASDALRRERAAAAMLKNPRKRRYSVGGSLPVRTGERRAADPSTS
jgi:hypothetical protein